MASPKVAKCRGKIGRSLQSFEDFLSGPASGFDCGSSVYLSSGCKILMGSHRGELGQLKVGNRVYVNHYAIIDCHYSISIGDEVLVGPNCYICDFDHGIVKGLPVTKQLDGKVASVRIEDGVWLGANSVVLKGVTIGREAVIGAGAIVTRNVPAGEIFVGNPAHLLKTR